MSVGNRRDKSLKVPRLSDGFGSQGGGLCQGEEDDAKIGDRGVYWDGSGLSSGTECTYSTQLLDVLLRGNDPYLMYSSSEATLEVTAAELLTLLYHNAGRAGGRRAGVQA